MKRKEKGSKAIALVMLTVGAAITLLPFVWMILSAFKPDYEIISSIPTFFPKDFTLQHFQNLFRSMKFGVYIKNSLIIVAYAFVGMFISAMAGYGFAKFNFKHKEKWFIIILATMMIPVQTLLIPIYLMVLKMGLINTFLGMALPAFVSGYSIFLFRQFMSTVPNEMLEAARIDGAGEFRIFLSIALPQIKSALIVQAIITFMGAWNYFLYPLILANDDAHYTLSVAIALLKNESGSNFGLQLAGAVIAVLPVLVIVIAFSKYIKEGFATDGIKG